MNNQELINLCTEANPLKKMKKIINKVDIEEVNELGCTALSIALRYSREDVVHFLLDHKANINYVIPQFNWSMLRLALKYQTISVVEKILEKVDTKYLEMKDFNNWYPIHHLTNRPEREFGRVIKWFVDMGVNLEVQTDADAKPIHYVCQNHDIEIINMFIDLGVDMQCVCAENWTPLHFLCDRTDTYICIKKILETKNINLEVKTDVDCTILHHACRKSEFNIIKLLVEAKANINAKNNEGWTALHYACCYQNKNIIELLINNGANMNLKVNNGASARRILAFYNCKNNALIEWFKKKLAEHN
jgi:ankyrin repeat protein